MIEAVAVVGAVLLTLAFIPISRVVGWLHEKIAEDEETSNSLGIILAVLGVILTFNPFTFIFAVVVAELLLMLAPFMAAAGLLYMVLGPTAAIIYGAGLGTLIFFWCMLCHMEG